MKIYEIKEKAVTDTKILLVKNVKERIVQALTEAKVTDYRAKTKGEKPPEQE